jgi:hypothetical protein
MSDAPGKLIESDDGSGDWILQFDEEWLKENDWRAGDNIDVDLVNGTIVLSNSDKKKRNDESISQ